MLKRLFYILTIFALLWVCGLFFYAYIVRNIEPYGGNAEGIVVLTGGEGRVEAGLRLLEQNRGARLLISGVHHDVKLRELLQLNHSDPKLADLIDLGFAAQDTLGNADETASWIEKNRMQSVIVVTAHYHMPRAMVHLGTQLPDVALYPYPVVPKAFRTDKWYFDFQAIRMVMQDYNKFLLTYPQILFMNKV